MQPRLAPITSSASSVPASAGPEQGQTPLALTVVIPTRDRPKLLLKVLTGLQNQRGLDLRTMEVVVVVDGGPDRTAQLLNSLAHGYHLRVLEILHAGTPGARDAGWRTAAAPLILFLDDDVVPSPRLVAEHLTVQRDVGPCVALGRVAPPGCRRPAWTAYDDRVLTRKYARLLRDEVPSGIHYGGNVSMPRELLEMVGGHDHVLQHDSDVELGDRLRARGVRFVYRPAALGAHRGAADYSTWRRRHFLHGRVDVALRRDRGLTGGLQGLLACYHDRHPLNRLVVRLGLGRRSRDHGGLVDILAVVGKIAYRLRMDGLSYGAFSAAANLLYWSGVRDAMRGSDPFWQAVRSVRHHRGRPYLPKTKRR
jgi:glycosyltransferase involved in cell wall biosynthesis